MAKAPNTANYLNTLGTARCRAGDWEAGMVDLEMAISLRKPDDPLNAYDGFFLAMAHWQLGDREQARAWFEKAVAWMEKGPKERQAEMQSFRDEAAERLGIRK